MHACGHSKAEMNGPVKLCFQQAGERGGGTEETLKVLAPFPAKCAFAIH